MIQVADIMAIKEFFKRLFHRHEWTEWTPFIHYRECKSCDLAELYDHWTWDTVRFKRKI